MSGSRRDSGDGAPVAGAADRPATGPEPPRLDQFRFLHEVEVRFRDLDPMGHVHHSLPLMYWEEARARYWREVAGRPDVASIDYVMGEFTLRFHRRILFPNRLRSGVRATRLGRSSFELAYGLWDAQDQLLSAGHSTQVLYDYQAGRSKPLDDETRRRIEEWEGRPLR